MWKEAGVACAVSHRACRDYFCNAFFFGSDKQQSSVICNFYFLFLKGDRIEEAL